MISRETTRQIARLVTNHFSSSRNYSPYGGPRRNYTGSDSTSVYDFLFDADFPAWFCNAARKACSSTSTRPLQDFLMKLHTGESQYAATEGWSWPEREKLGQQYLQQLAEAMLKYLGEPSQYLRKGEDSLIEDIRKRLELDGFVFRDTSLLAPEEDVLDAEEAAGVLQRLYGELQLEDASTAMHHLKLSEEHYLAERWDDAISNSRKFLECVLREVARRHSLAIKGAELSEGAAKQPARIRDYLESAGLIEAQEKKTVASIYGLLSATGGHPYMAENDQARLLRHLALTVSQFVMLRLRGALATRT